MREIKLEPGEIEVFKALRACDAASERIVTEAIRHWERSHMAWEEAWQAAREKHDLKSDDVMSFDPYTQSIFVFDEAEVFERKLKEHSAERAAVRRRFGIPDEMKGP